MVALSSFARLPTLRSSVCSSLMGPVSPAPGTALAGRSPAPAAASAAAGGEPGVDGDLDGPPDDEGRRPDADRGPVQGRAGADPHPLPVEVGRLRRPHDRQRRGGAAYVQLAVRRPPAVVGA